VNFYALLKRRSGATFLLAAGVKVRTGVSWTQSTVEGDYPETMRVAGVAFSRTDEHHVDARGDHFQHYEEV
jgi:hypothetical protein